MPAVTVEVIDAPISRSAPTSTDTLFITAESEKGAHGVAHEITSMNALENIAGEATTAGQLLHDAEHYFNQGGSRLYFSRILGPAPVKATANLFDAAGSTIPGDVSLVATAKDAGAWGNDIDVTITVDGTDFVVAVSDADGVVETSPEVADRAAAVAWATDSSSYIDLALGASAEDPRAQVANLATGTDDRTNITDTERAAAYTPFTSALGPGQIIEPGVTAAAAWTRLKNHAALNNRVAILDCADTGTAATLTAAADAARTNGRFAQAVAPWAVVPGDAAGTTREIPYSYIQAGIIARNDNAGQSPNVAAAGENGRARGLVGLSQTYSDDDYETLDAAGITVAREIFGQVSTEGVATLADAATDPLWDQFPATRLLMRLRSLAYNVAFRARFNQIDGRKLVFAQLRSDLEAEVCLPYYKAGSLYGESPEEAFRVDTGDQVNTPVTIAARQIKAAIGVRVSPSAEFVYIQIARSATTQPV